MLEAINETRQLLFEQHAELEAEHASYPEDAACDECGGSGKTCVGVPGQHCFDCGCEAVPCAV